MKHFLFIRGLPASGKITIARELEKQFGWRVLWIHGIKNAIWDVVKKHDLRQLMREVLDPIVRFMLEEKLDIIFVRTAMDRETIERVRAEVAKHPDYRFDLVTLLADKQTLLERAQSRPFDEHRPSDEKSLNEYLA
ncbi:MAG: AAA family ATPase, partial [Patescibacteria group bacterium]